MTNAEGLLQRIVRIRHPLLFIFAFFMSHFLELLLGVFQNGFLAPFWLLSFWRHFPCFRVPLAPFWFPLAPFWIPFGSRLAPVWLPFIL